MTMTKIAERHMTYRSLSALKPLARNARTHSSSQIRQIASSIERFGFNNPVLVDDDDRILAGHGRLAAAKLIGLADIPVIRLGDMTMAERKAYALADNKIALNAGWDQELLALELQELIDLDFEVELTGFAIAEIDLTLDAALQMSKTLSDSSADEIPPLEQSAVSRTGDLWQLGKHVLLCGDAREPADLAKLMGGKQAAMAFTDPPYNVPIDGHVCGMGKITHREFAMGAGEMSRVQFTGFLEVALRNMTVHSASGAILFVCMDWRHMRELQDAGEAAGLELKNLCVWNKSNGGMGTFYRSKHELVFAFKYGDAPHINSFGLGDTGRYRTNVWDYPGISSIGSNRDDELAMHPTVKPVALVADAIKDCSRRGDIILDPFGGSGTTLIAAQQTGRIARLIEYDPLYCDTIIRRFERETGKLAVHLDKQCSFDELADMRQELETAQ